MGRWVGGWVRAVVKGKRGGVKGFYFVRQQGMQTRNYGRNQVILDDARKESMLTYISYITCGKGVAVWSVLFRGYCSSEEEG